MAALRHGLGIRHHQDDDQADGPTRRPVPRAKPADDRIAQLQVERAVLAAEYDRLVDHAAELDDAIKDVDGRIRDARRGKAQSGGRAG